MKLSRTNLTVAIAAAVAISSAIAWSAAGAAPGDSVDRAHTQALEGGSGRAGTVTQPKNANASPSSKTASTVGTQLRLTALPELDPTTVAASVTYLQAQYGVTETEAVRRLRLQVEADQLDAALRSSLPDLYAGMWLDQA